MSDIEKAKDTYSKVLKVASEFISPSIKEFFTRKANNDYNNLKESTNLNKKAVEIYVEKQKDLFKSLNRMVGIYNMFNDKFSTL